MIMTTPINGNPKIQNKQPTVKIGDLLIKIRVNKINNIIVPIPMISIF